MTKGDRLLRIEGESVEGLLLEAVVRRLRGAPGSQVRITIERKGEEYDVIARRSPLPYSGADSALYDGGLAYIRIRQFFQSSAKELEKHIAGFKLVTGGRIRGVVLDLRGNTGGVLNGAIAVADAFLDDGLILSTHGRGADSKLKFYATARPGELGADVPLFVLVDAETGAGAEMLAALLQDRKRARVVGTTTVGLNSIQTLFPLKDGSALKLTTSKMLRPSGRALDEAGVIPDVCIRSGKPIFLDREQLERAGSARKACPAATQSYENELDDLELRYALDALRTKREAHRSESWKQNALNVRRRASGRETLASHAAVEAGAAVYRAEDGHPWLERLARNRRTARPKPWRK